MSLASLVTNDTVSYEGMGRLIPIALSDSRLTADDGLYRGLELDELYLGFSRIVSRQSST